MKFKKWNGYFTIEASFIVPMILCLYLLVVSVALFLYDRCLISQDGFLLGMRAATFTCAGESYGEVIYGNAGGTAFSKEDYVTERWEMRRPYYLENKWGKLVCITGKDDIQISFCGITDTNRINKKLQILNPVKEIREGRKNNHVSSKVL